MPVNDAHFTSSQLTVRIVRQELATRFDLEEDDLNSGIYKSFVKDTVHATVVRAHAFLVVVACVVNDWHGLSSSPEQPPERVGRGRWVVSAESCQEGKVGWYGESWPTQT